MRSATLFLLIFVAMLAINAMPAKANKIFRFPLKRRVHHNNVTSQFDRRTQVQYPMKHGSMQYTINIGVGDPPQNFDLVVATGVGNILIADAWCANCGNPAVMPTYSGGASRSYHDLEKEFSDWGGTVTGDWTADDFKMFGRDLRRPFVRCETVPSSWVTDAKYSGMLGLGLHKPNGVLYLTFLDYLQRLDLLDKNLFSFRIEKGSTNELAGDLLFGGVEQALIKGDIQYTSLTSGPEGLFWLIPILDVQSGQQSLGETVVRVDTAIQHIYLRRDMVQQIYAGTDAQRQSDGIWAVPDYFRFDVSFVIDERMFTVPNTDIPLKHFPKYGDLYRGAIQETDKDFVLGIPFLQNFYVVFDFTKGSQSIGIGELRQS